MELPRGMEDHDGVSTEKSHKNLQINDGFHLDTVSSPVLSHTITCKTIEDHDKPFLHDIVIIDVEGSDTIIVTDYKNKCIKSFHMRLNQWHHSLLSCKSSPRRIAKLEDNKIAVTLPDSEQIAVVSVTPDLILDSTIPTQKRYWGLTALTSTTLAAGYDSPPGIDILDRSWNVMRSIIPTHNGEEIIEDPYYLCTTRQGNILISDHFTSSVKCVTPEGVMVFNYLPSGDRELRWPGGITSTATGHILVVDNYRERVIQLSESGEFVRDILTSKDGISGPWGIAWDERGRIFVTAWNEINDVNVQVFTFK